MVSILVAVGATVGAVGLAVALLLDARAGNDRRAPRRPPVSRDDAPAAERGDILELSEWLHEVLMQAYGAERAEWALERVQRVTERLQALRPAEPKWITEVLWIPEVTAFTAPGRYIYVSRRLLERCASDEPVAFVGAHELAHHHLGHTELFHGWQAKLPQGAGALTIATGFRVLERFLYGPEREAAADAHALDLCLAAGYNLRECLKLFDILEADALDHGDLTAVFGPEVPDEDAGGEWMRSLKAWVHQRQRGYPSIRDRKAALQRRAAGFSAARI